jgi:hypothetical protein
MRRRSSTAVAVTASPGPATRPLAGLASAALVLAALLLAGCSGGGSGFGDAVIVRNDADPYNLAAAQAIADRECAGRGGGRAQYLTLQNNARSAGGQGGGGGWGPPEILYRCTPGATR